jgi:Glycosyltransferase family 9 (heptosyltransferase)
MELGKERPRFLDSDPFVFSMRYAMEHGCDLAVPGEIGIGSLVCYTRLVEEFALREGRSIRLLTVPLDCSEDERRSEGEGDYPLWDGNPFVETIVNADLIDPEISGNLSAEMDNFCQARHEIENLCAPYGLRPRALRGSLFLSREEMQWGLGELSDLKRPVVCLCPYGRSSSLPGSPWHLKRWMELIEALDGVAGLYQIGNDSFEQKPLPIFTPKTTIRKIVALLWASDLYIGFDTGPSHIATALAKPAVVLWDAVRKAPLEEAKQAGFSIAHMSRWAYPQNRNLVILGEKEREVLDGCLEFVFETVASFKRTRP